MPTTDIMIAFFLASAVFAYMPGPSTLYAAAQTIARGRRAGWMAALGIHIGGYVHVVAAAAGLAILFQTIPALYTMLKLAGAAYLVWLGFQLLTSQQEPPSTDVAMSKNSPRRAFWDSVSVEVLNPKTALFYLAFLPQFTDAAAGLPVWAQLVVLGTIVNVMFSSADILCVLLADKITRWMKTSRSANRIARKVGGGLLIGLGLNLVANRQ